MGYRAGEGVAVRRIEARDIDAAIAIGSTLGWPSWRDNWRWFLETGQGFAAIEGGRVVGTTLYWTYGPAFASLGAVMVEAGSQGRGIAGTLMTLCLAELGSRSVQLYATEAGRPLYEKRRFAPFERVVQHQGEVIASATFVASDHALRPMKMRDRPAALALAERSNGLSRAMLMDSLFDISHGVLLERQGLLKGLALSRRNDTGWTVGPVIAPDLPSAQALIGNRLCEHAGGVVRIDVAEHRDLEAWLDSCGLRAVGAALGMIRGLRPVRDPAAHPYAIVNQAMG